MLLSLIVSIAFISSLRACCFLKGLRNIYPSKSRTVSVFLISREFSSDEHSLLVQAETELLWEKYERKLAKPILNLSRISNGESLDIGDVTRDRKTDKEAIRPLTWIQTKDGLSMLGICMDKNRTTLQTCESYIDETEFLKNAPHLLRLDSLIVVETATCLIDIMGKERGVDMIKRNPSLLTFRAAHVSYGFEFLSNMMGIRSSNESVFIPSSNVLSVCFNKPSLLIAGIEGGIQEKYVQKTLGDAGSAISGASKQIVGDISTFLNNRETIPYR